jgi:4-hydroxybenzoate polyprenyltransferase
VIAGDDTRLQVISSSRLYVLYGLLRIKQWTKNLIIFVPVLFAAKIHEAAALERALLCFAAFCMLSSSIYIVNDIFDLKQDNGHPTKCRRPIASGEISTMTALSISIACALAGLMLMSSIYLSLFVIGITYLALMLTYNLILKKHMLLDVFAIVAGFVLRVVAGAASVPVMPSGWLLLCASLGALFLALDKRRQELNILQGEAGNHRKTLNNYSASMLRRMETIVVFCLLSCYLLFSMLSYHGKAMLLTVPFAIYGVVRYCRLADKSSGTYMAEDVLIKDRPIQTAIMLWVITAAFVVYGTGHI